MHKDKQDVWRLIPPREHAGGMRQPSRWGQGNYERSKSMSCDKWAYDPDRCDDHVCCGDCDLCLLKDITLEDIEEEEENEKEHM